MQNQDIEYVIYCRKSTKDEERQSESIPRQIDLCLEYAEKNKLKLLKKPEDFSDFETVKDIAIVENDTFENKKIYKKAEPYFIITEQETGKIYGKRPKRRLLISMVKQGRIKGIISYSPDRQARNMLEGGELIDLVDKEKLKLKYSNFHFENTPDGKMMLGIWFVFSKQYSDKISVDVNHGNKKTVADGKSLGKYKYGYYRDPKDGHYKPDGKNFDLMKQAFHLRLYKQKKYEYIVERLNRNGFEKTNGKPIKKTSLTRIFTSRFYFGILREGNNEIDLRSGNYDFVPMITEDEREVLQTMKKGGSNEKNSKEIKKENRELCCFSDGLLIYEDCRKMSIDIPSKGRYEKKLKELQTTNKKATLLDVIQPHQIYYTAGANKRKGLQKVSIRHSEVEKFIIEILKGLKCDKKSYESYVKAKSIEIQKKKEYANEDRHNIIFQINKKQSKMEELTRSYLKAQENLNDVGKITEVYNKEMRILEKEVLELEEDLSSVNKEQRNHLIEIGMFYELATRAAEVYIKAPNVRKQEITSIFFSNIALDNKKRLHIAVKPLFKDLFVSYGAGDETRTRNNLLGRQKL